MNKRLLKRNRKLEVAEISINGHKRQKDCPYNKHFRNHYRNNYWNRIRKRTKFYNRKWYCLNYHYYFGKEFSIDIALRNDGNCSNQKCLCCWCKCGIDLGRINSKYDDEPQCYHKDTYYYAFIEKIKQVFYNLKF